MTFIQQLIHSVAFWIGFYIGFSWVSFLFVVKLRLKQLLKAGGEQAMMANLAKQSWNGPAGKKIKDRLFKPFQSGNFLLLLIIVMYLVLVPILFLPVLFVPFKKKKSLPIKETVNKEDDPTEFVPPGE